MPNNPSRLFGTNDSVKELEINADQASELAKKGSRVFVFSRSPYDGELLKEVLGVQSVQELDINEVSPIIYGYGDRDEAQKLAASFENAVIVCPHGNTSRIMAEALLQFNVKAYSLKEGMEGLKKRG
ncbi:MAG: hypothetical protein KGH69_04275 [Candidatus Micrarchaeota archaeon]|nr:hypothetical protein [Candidatus Micrarchaeota archaeon]